MTENLLTVQEVAALRGVAKSTVHDWIKRGHLDHLRQYGRVLIPRSAALAYEPGPVGWPKGRAGYRWAGQPATAPRKAPTDS